MADIQTIVSQLVQLHQHQPGRDVNVPDEAELAALLEGNIGEKRRREIYGYLNRDTELFAQWLALVDARTDVSVLEQSDTAKAEKESKDRGWFGFWQTSLTFAVIVLVAGPVMFIMNPRWNNDAVTTLDIGDLNMEEAYRELGEVIDDFVPPCGESGFVEVDREKAQLLLNEQKMALETAQLPLPVSFENANLENPLDTQQVCEIILALDQELND